MEAERKMQISYDEINQRLKGERRQIHDDISVVVMFLVHQVMGQNGSVTEMSIRGFSNTVGPSRFDVSGIT